MLACWLPWKCKPNAFVLLCLIEHHKVVAFRLTREVTINNLGNQQRLEFRAFLELVKNRTNFTSNQRLILVSRCSTLFELPLPFEECGFVNKGKHVVQRDIFHHSGSEEGRRGYQHI